MRGRCLEGTVIARQRVLFATHLSVKIAEVGDDFLKLFDGGCQSTTTKSRLNALLSEFGYTCGTKQEFIFQKQFEWFIQMFDLTEEAMRTIPFTNGMRLAG